jgi:type IV secretory pathway TrbD component
MSNPERSSIRERVGTTAEMGGIVAGVIGLFKNMQSMAAIGLGMWLVGHVMRPQAR